jgi:alanine dehydrogenase
VTVPATVPATVPVPLAVGVPRERKEGEHRVAITPDGVHELVVHDVPVIVEHDAGSGSSIRDDDFRAAGAEIVTDGDDVWARSDLVLKVKEPQPDELDHLRPGLVLFTYLHLAAYPPVADALLAREVTGVAYETVQLESGVLPLLAPMSEVAGRMAPQVGSHFLEREHGGRGVLLGGAPGVRPARVVVLGAGNVGWNAAWIAQGMEAEVLLLDRNIDRLRWVDQIHKGRIMTLASNRLAVERAVAEADLVIGAVLVPGGRAPIVVTASMVRSMRTGAVIVDCAIDQGGCVEGIHETSHAEPVYEVDGVLHYAVGNIPAAVPNTSTYALTNATLPYAVALATRGVRAAVSEDPELATGVNTVAGQVVNPAVADALGKPCAPLADALPAR